MLHQQPKSLEDQQKLVGDEGKEGKESKMDVFVIKYPGTLFGGGQSGPEMSIEQKIDLSERLVKACIDGYSDLAMKYIAQGADVNHSSRVYSIQCRNLLTNKMITSTPSPLLAAIENRLDGVVSELIAKGANVNACYDYGYNDGQYKTIGKGETLLHCAAKIPNNGKVIKALIEGGADPKAIASYHDSWNQVFCSDAFEGRNDFLWRECAISHLLGCLVLGFVCMLQRETFAKFPHVTPLDVARHYGHAENVQAIQSAMASYKPARMVMK
jgi:hypothetical protein